MWILTGFITSLMMNLGTDVTSDDEPRKRYTGWAKKKVNPKCSTHNFVKYWPILKILSLL